MHKILRLAAACALALLSSCASIEAVHGIDDGEALDPKLAYVLVSAYVTLNHKQAPMATGKLTRVSSDGQTHTATFRVPNGHVQILALEPGVWFLSEWHGGLINYTFAPDQSVFVARAGQLSYPGQWVFTTQEITQTKMTSLELSYRDDFSSVNDLDASARQRFEQQYPQTSRTAKLVYTRTRRP